MLKKTDLYKGIKNLLMDNIICVLWCYSEALGKKTWEMLEKRVKLLWSLSVSV